MPGQLENVDVFGRAEKFKPLCDTSSCALEQTPTRALQQNRARSLNLLRAREIIVAFLHLRFLICTLLHPVRVPLAYNYRLLKL